MNTIKTVLCNITYKSKLSFLAIIGFIAAFIITQICLSVGILCFSTSLIAVGYIGIAIVLVLSWKIVCEFMDMIQINLEIEKKNTYLEHAAKILRHDMHAGINTYIPRGISSLTRRIPESMITELRLQAPLQMMQDGLIHTQKVYKGVYEFTNLVKTDSKLSKTPCQLDIILKSYLETTSYGNQVIIDPLPFLEVNEALFCTAVDNLIRNGLKYNDSETKKIHIYIEGDQLMIQDNGRGMTQSEFEQLSKPYTRREGQQESGTGLGLGISVAIMKEHGFTIGCERNDIGTKMKIGLC